MLLLLVIYSCAVRQSVVLYQQEKQGKPKSVVNEVLHEQEDQATFECMALSIEQYEQEKQAKLKSIYHLIKQVIEASEEASEDSCWCFFYCRCCYYIIQV